MIKINNIKKLVLISILCLATFFLKDVSASKFGQVAVRGGVSNNLAEVDAENQLYTVLKGRVDSNNSTSDALGVGGVFTGAATDTLDFGFIFVTVYSNVDSATDGLSVQQSSNGINWDNTDEYTILASTGKTFSFQPGARYFRVVFTNGGTGQTIGGFRLQTILKRTSSLSSSHRIGDSIVGDDDAVLNKSVITALELSSDSFVNIEATGGALDVHVQDVHDKLINRYVMDFTGTVSNLAVNATAGNTTITVVNSAIFSVGDWVFITEDSVEEVNAMKITALPAVNGITLDRPIDNSYTSVTPAVVEVVEVDLSTASGTLVSPVSFKAQPPSNQTWHILRFLISMQDNLAMDTAKFGGLTALTNGVIFRVNNNGATRVITNWKANSDIMEDSYDVVFHDKAPAGEYGLAARFTIHKAKAYIRLDGSNGDYIEVLVQDGLTGLTDMEIKAQGHIED